MSIDQDMGSGGSGSGTTSVIQRPRNANGLDGDLVGGGSDSTTIATARPRGGASGLGENEFAVGEVGGEESSSGASATAIEAAHAEVSSAETTGSGEEYIEASPAELAAAESGEESAFSDLRGIEGFEASGFAQEGDIRVEAPLREAGEALEGGQEEFFPILAALVPTLISTIGPAVAKGVMGKLSPRAKRAIQRRVPRAAGAAVKGAQGAGGTSGLLALVAKLLATAQTKPGSESGMEVDEAFIESAVAAIEEIIIGDDQRERITQTMDLPWRRICSLRITFPSGSSVFGTGFFISQRAVATAGHCVYMHNQGGWARKVEVIPGRNGSSRPFGQVVSTSFRSVSGWVTDKKPEHDYGCILLPAGSFNGKNLGSFGFGVFSTPNLLAKPAVVAGYPGDKPTPPGGERGGELWGMKRLIKGVTAKTLVYDIDTMGGQSGAPVYITRNGVRYVVGIHNYGAASGNSATRVTKPVGERLLAWSKL